MALRADTDVKPKPVLTILWSVPRSVSTAFERTFVGRRGVAVVHEPYTRSYYFGSSRRSARYGDGPSRADHDGNREIFAALAAQPDLVFVKELAFQAAPYVTDEVLCRAANTFLIRHPHRVLASLLPLKPDATEDEFGFTALAALWRRVCAVTPGRLPLLLDGDEFRNDPHGVLRHFCEAVGIPFEPGALSWRSGRIRDWESDERESQAKWHKTLERSVGIIPVTPLDAVAVPDHLAGAVARALDIYEDLMGRRADPGWARPSYGLQADVLETSA